MRAAGNWLQAYREYSNESEAPDSFHLWIALSCIASVVGRKVRLDMGIFPVYPSLFVILVSPPGRVGKSTNLRMGREILQRVEEIFMGPDSCTREELIHSMSQAESATQTSVTIHSSELSSLIDPSGIKMVQFLTDIYDCPSLWRYDTKSSGKFNLFRPCLNLLGATTPSWISEGFPEKATQHGFTARTIFVYEEDTRKSNPWPEAPPAELIEALVDDLRDLAKLEGVFRVDADAKASYSALYEEWRTGVPDDHRIEGYYYRKRIHVLKVAMLISLAESDDLVLSLRDIETAVALLEMVEEQMPRTFSAVGKYEHAADLERILSQVHESGGVSLAEIFTRNYREGSKTEIHEIVQMLLAMGAVKVEPRGGTTMVVPVGVREKKERRHLTVLPGGEGQA